MDVPRTQLHGQTPAARVGAVIRDYAAYRAKDQRRLDDKRVRAFIALRLAASVRELLSFRSVQGDRMNGAADEFDLSLRRLRNAIDAVTDVPVGYSTFFDAHSVPPANADRLIVADLELIERAQGLVQFVGQLTRGVPDDDGFRDGCSSLCRRVTDLARLLEQRSEIFAA